MFWWPSHNIHMNFTCDCLITFLYKARHFALMKVNQARPTKLRDPGTMVVRAVNFSSGGYKIGKIVA